jgi:hypothetical protein
LAVTQQAEALFGAAIPEPERNYVEDEGAIPIAPDAAGNNAILVKRYRHPDPMAELLRWQVCEAGIIQAVGRARGILRTAADPLDIWLLTDVPVPEIGKVVPVLWGEIAPGGRRPHADRRGLARKRGGRGPRVPGDRWVGASREE